MPRLHSPSAQDAQGESPLAARPKTGSHWATPQTPDSADGTSASPPLEECGFAAALLDKRVQEQPQRQEKAEAQVQRRRRAHEAVEAGRLALPQQT